MVDYFNQERNHLNGISSDKYVSRWSWEIDGTERRWRLVLIYRLRRLNCASRQLQPSKPSPTVASGLLSRTENSTELLGMFRRRSVRISKQEVYYHT